MSLYLNIDDADNDREYTDDELDTILQAVREAIESGTNNYVCLEFYRDEAE